MILRQAKENDVPALIEIERVCFPAAEAAGEAQIRARFAAFPENFFVAEEDGAVVGFVNGCTTDAQALPDSLYHDTGLHRPGGAYQTVFGLDVLPAFRRRGVAAALLNRLIDTARARGCRGVVLTCKDRLKPYYEKFGFVCQGVSASTHGGAAWNDMLLRF